MTRLEFQVLASERADDAIALLGAKRYACAYYICGYAIECGLKACIARQTRQDDFPPKDAGRYYTHDISRLLDIAALGPAFQREVSNDPLFRANWAVVKDWTEESRYQARGRQDAEDIVAAVTDPQHGVLRWLKQNW